MAENRSGRAAVALRTRLSLVQCRCEVAGESVEPNAGSVAVSEEPPPRRRRRRLRQCRRRAARVRSGRHGVPACGRCRSHREWSSTCEGKGVVIAPPRGSRSRRAGAGGRCRSAEEHVAARPAVRTSLRRRRRAFAKRRAPLASSSDRVVRPWPNTFISRCCYGGRPQNTGRRRRGPVLHAGCGCRVMLCSGSRRTPSAAPRPGRRAGGRRRVRSKTIPNASFIAVVSVCPCGGRAAHVPLSQPGSATGVPQPEHAPAGAACFGGT